MTQPPLKKLKSWKEEPTLRGVPKNEALALFHGTRVESRYLARCTGLNCTRQDELYRTSALGCHHLWHRQCLVDIWRCQSRNLRGTGIRTV